MTRGDDVSGVFGNIEQPVKKPQSYASMSNVELLQLYRDSWYLHGNPSARENWDGYYATSRDALNLIAETILNRMSRGGSDVERIKKLAQRLIDPNTSQVDYEIVLEHADELARWILDITD